MDSVTPTTSTSAELIKQAAQAQNQKSLERTASDSGESQRADAAALQLGLGANLDVSI